MDAVLGLFNAGLLLMFVKEIQSYMNYKLNFYTQYHQIYVSDKGSSQDTSNANFWTAEATYSRLAIAEGILGIGLQCYGLVKGELVILDRGKEGIEFNHYNHILEGSINIESGVLQILDCPNKNVELEIEMNPGKYRVRIYSLHLASVLDDDSGDDYYIIEVWPDNDLDRTVLKQYAKKMKSPE